MIYRCKMTKTIYVNIKADDPDAAQDYINTVELETLINRGTYDDVEYSDDIVAQYMEPDDYDIDISTKTNDEYDEPFNMTEDEIRADFAKAFDKVEAGTELSGILGWGFSDEDIIQLTMLHRDRPRYREKIEDLLEDCNFHTGCGWLEEGRYDMILDPIPAF